MGGKSSSSTTTTTTQEVFTENNQADASGVITGNVLQGEITYSDEFSDNVSGAFDALINLSNRSLDLVSEAGGLIGDTGAQAIDYVARRVEQQEEPEIAAVKELFPIIMAGIIVGGVAYVATKGKFFKNV
jgi:hypothetical protein